MDSFINTFFGREQEEPADESNGDHSGSYRLMISELSKKAIICQDVLNCIFEKYGKMDRELSQKGKHAENGYKVVYSSDWSGTIGEDYLEIISKLFPRFDPETAFDNSRACEYFMEKKEEAEADLKLISEMRISKMDTLNKRLLD